MVPESKMSVLVYMVYHILASEEYEANNNMRHESIFSCTRYVQITANFLLLTTDKSVESC